MKYIVLLLLILSINVAHAHDVYRWVTPNGVVHFSDVPYPGAERIILPEWPQPGPLHYMAPLVPRAYKKPDIAMYKRLAIIKPKPRENIRDNQGNVVVELTIQPKLDVTADHKIQLLLDGKIQGDSTQSLSHTLSVNRGRHIVIAQVIDEQGNVLISSRPVRFFLKTASPLFHTKHPDVSSTGVQQAPRAPMAPRAPRAPHAPFRPFVNPAPPPGSASGSH